MARFFETIRRAWEFRNMTIGKMPVGSAGYVLVGDLCTDGVSYWLNSRAPVSHRSIGMLGKYVEVHVKHRPNGYQAIVSINATPRSISTPDKNCIRTWVRWESR